MKHNQTMRRGLGILLSLVMCLSLLPATALAAEPATATADFTTNADGALALLNAAKTGTADSTWADNTLTLKGVNFSTTAATAVKLPAGAKIVLAEGTENTITSVCEEADRSYGICAYDGLTIQGSGTLTATGGTSNLTDGIYATYVTIQGAVTVTAAGGSGIVGVQGSSCGIYGLRKVTISDNATVTATGGKANTSYGIRVPGQGEGYGVNIQGGTVTATGDEAFEYSYGISSENDVTISNNAKVTATGGKTNLSYGISSENDITISGNAEVTATGGEATARSYGILANKGDVLIKGGTVTATGDKADNDSYGIYNNGDFTIENGEVNVTAGTAGSNSFGIYVYGGDFTIKNGEVNVTAGEANKFSYGICTAAKYENDSNSWINGDITISGCHVTAQTLAGDTAQRKSALALYNGGTLDLSSYTGYQWRTSASGDFNTTPYTYDAAHTYVEFYNGQTNTCTVTFDPNDGSDAKKDVTVVSGSFTLPVCTFTAPSGKQFAGWATSADGTVISGTTITVTGDTTLYAVWEDIPVTTYTVSFDDNGGTLNEGCKTSIETEPDGTVDYLPRATREGYTFDGWYTEADGGEKVYTYVTVFTADTTVYAHWTLEADTKQITEASFAMKGYTVGANAEDIVITSYTEGLSLTGGYFEALGKPFSYLIAVVSGDDYAPITGALEAGKKYVLMLKADVNAGYDVGSGVTKDTVTLNGTITADDCSVLKEESTLGISFVLPVLKENDTPAAAYTVTVNGSNASVTGAGEYEAGDLVTLAAGSRSGYTFSGWTSDDITIPNASSADTSFVMPAKAVTVTANWTRIGGSSTPTYAPSVTQPENGAVTVSPKAPKKGDTVTITPKPEDGYTVEQILVTDKDGNPVKVTNNGNGTYSFTQPAGKVNVEVTFMEDNSMLNFFVDVPTNAYYYDAVLWAAENGITGGVDDTHFAPDASCTRGQMVTFLWRAAGSPKVSGTNPFSDVSADAYYYDAVLWAVKNGITSGTSATTFAPDATVTRGQTVTFLYRAAGSPAASGFSFSDVSSDAYYANAVAWAVQQNITTGTGNGQFSPDADCTRAQIVTFLFRAMGE